MSTFGDHIRSKLYSGLCPGQGARGELAYIEHTGTTPRGSDHYYARLYVWDDKVTGREVASWFKDAGADTVEIDQQIHDEWNNVYEGRCEDGVRSWDIKFATPATEKPAPPPPTICVAEYQWQGQTRQLPAQQLLDAIALECPAAPMTLAITLSTIPNPNA
jgi:hypothetical protein